MHISLTIGLMSAGCVFGGVLLGLWLQGILPAAHLTDDSKDSIKWYAGMIATVSALVLGLLVASAKNTFDTTQAQITQRSAKIMFLDRVLADYGPETKATRELLRRTVADSIDMIWNTRTSAAEGMSEYERMNGMRVTQMTLLKLTPVTDAQRQLFATAQQLISELRESRWLLIAQGQNAVPVSLLVVLLFWLTMLHIIFGLFAPRNATVVTVMFISVLSVSAAIFIVFDMTRPFEGMVNVSSGPMKKALEHLGR